MQRCVERLPNSLRAMGGVDPLWEIQALTKKHKRESFDSGEPALDGFLKQQARQNADRGISRTWVAVRGSTHLVEGYYTLRSGQVAFEVLPEDEKKKLPRYPVPVVHWARLAVTKSAAGLGLGETLLMDAFEKTLRVEHDVGVYAVEVFAKTERARAFYARYGFHSLRDDPLHMYLGLAAIRNAFGGA